jgi:hypothetical protein
MAPVAGVWRDVADRLTPVALPVREGFVALPPTRGAHAAIWRERLQQGESQAAFWSGRKT